MPAPADSPRLMPTLILRPVGRHQRSLRQPGQIRELVELLHRQVRQRRHMPVRQHHQVAGL
jgi:hypothetical protein